MSEQGGGKTKSNVGKELRKSRQLLMDIEKAGVLTMWSDSFEKQTT